MHIVALIILSFLLKLFLFYLLALAVGFIAGWIYSLLFGAAYSILPAGSLHRWRYHNKLYLHFVWFSRQLVTTLAACVLLTAFGVAIFDVAIAWPFIFLLCVAPAFAFFSKQLRRPENLGYFNFMLDDTRLALDQTKLAESERYIVITNRLEGVSRIAGLFAGLFVARLMLT